MAPPCHQIAGYNAAGAWKLARGRPDVVIAILDTGIKWDREGLRTQVHLNTGELPLPEDAAGQSHPAGLEVPALLPGRTGPAGRHDLRLLR